ncbi:MAG: phytoene desaturase family protein [Actinomycetota bacterium]
MASSGAPRRVAIVGGGVGGLATAIRMSSAGHAVELFERNPIVGGKLATLQRDGFTFDIGPSLVTWPDVFDDLFRCAGTSLAEQLDLVRLDPQFHYSWPDDSTLVVHDKPQQTEQAFERFAPGAGADWRRFDQRAERIWEVARRTFFAGPMTGPLALAGRMRSPSDLTAIDPLRTLDSAARGCFDDHRLIQWAGRYATYSGSSPYRAPATLACIPHLESAHGCWYPMGGLDAIRAALEATARRLGTQIRTNTEVTRIVSGPHRVTGVELADGGCVPADIVVANVDAQHLYRDLLPQPGALRRVRRAPRSTSGFVMCVGAANEPSRAVGHHNVWFSSDERREFAALEAGRLADEPTIYACVSSMTDASQAPSGHENWFLLVNTPPGAHIDRDAYASLIFEQLAVRGVDLRTNAQFVETLTPTDIAERYRSPGGAIYGTSSDGRRAAFLRPANRGTRAGLYLVGGSSHPGGGLPLVVTSARIVADLIAEDL